MQGRHIDRTRGLWLWSHVNTFGLPQAATYAAIPRNGREAILSAPKFTYSLPRLRIHTPMHVRKRKPKELNLPSFTSQLAHSHSLISHLCSASLLHETRTNTNDLRTRRFLLNSHSKLRRVPSALSSPYYHIPEPTASMGLCASMLPWKAKKEQPEPRRGTPKALFVVRNDGRLSKPEALVFHPHRYCRSGLQKPGGVDSRKHEKCGYQCTDVLTRRLRAPKPPRIPCGSTRSVTVEPMAADKVRLPVSRGTTADGRAAAEGCRTPMTPRRTPLWQRRILMGTRCELPRFSGVILYDEHGQPLQSSSQNRADRQNPICFACVFM